MTDSPVDLGARRGTMSPTGSTDAPVTVSRQVLAEVHWLLKVLEDFAIDANPYAVNELVIFTARDLNRHSLRDLATTLDAPLLAALEEQST